MERSGQEPGHRGADDEVVEAAVVDLVLDPVELGSLIIDGGRPRGPGRSASRSPAGGPGRGPAGTTTSRPSRRRPRGRPPGRRTAGLLAVRDVPDGCVASLGGSPRATGCQVLVDPVGHEGRRDPLLPPVGLLHVEPPGMGRVPVVADVVVVEDHGARQGRQQPADLGPAPGLGVEAACTPRSRRPRRAGPVGLPPAADDASSPARGRRRRPGRPA